MNIKLIIISIGLLFSCSSEIIVTQTPNTDFDNGGLILPGGFGALVVADSVGPQDTLR